MLNLSQNFIFNAKAKKPAILFAELWAKEMSFVIDTKSDWMDNISNTNVLYIPNSLTGQPSSGDVILNGGKMFGGEWTTQDDMSAERYGHVAIVQSGTNRIWIFCGPSSGTAFQREDIWYWDFSTLAWTLVTSIDETAGNAAYFRAGGYLQDDRVFMQGGRKFSDGTITDTFLIYDISINSWWYGPSGAGRANQAGVGYVNKLYVIGGQEPASGLSSDVDYFDTVTSAWTFNVASVATPRYGHTAVERNGYVYIFGGRNNNERFKDLYEFDLSNYKYRSLATAPESCWPRCYHSACIIGDNMYIVGGEVAANSATSDCWQYNIASDRWTQVVSATIATRFATVNPGDGNAWLYGGIDGPTTQEAFSVMYQDSLSFIGSGSIRHQRDLGGIPTRDGLFTIKFTSPLSTSSNIFLIGASNSAFSSNVVTLSNAYDGQKLTNFLEFWRVHVNLFSSPDRLETPILHEYAISFPTDVRKYCSGTKRIIDYYPAIINDFPDFSSEIDFEDHLFGIGKINLKLFNTPETKSLLLDSYVSNCRTWLKVGFTDSTERDLAPVYTGRITKVKFKDATENKKRYITFDIEEPGLDLDVKLPMFTATGSYSNSNYPIISYDGTLMIYVIEDIIRGKVGFPDRYLDRNTFVSVANSMSFNLLDPSIGPYWASITPQQWKVKRLNIEGENAKDLIGELCLLSNTYLTVGEEGIYRLTEYKNTNTVVVSLSDIETREPFSSVLDFNKSFYNRASCGWGYISSSGDVDEITAYEGVYAYQDDTSIDNFAPGGERKEVSIEFFNKWLGPQSGYFGADLSKGISQRTVNQFKNGLIKIENFVLGLEYANLQTGDFISLTSSNFFKFGQSGCTNKKFMITDKKWDLKKGDLTFKLVEVI